MNVRVMVQEKEPNLDFLHSRMCGYITPIRLGFITSIVEGKEVTGEATMFVRDNWSHRRKNTDASKIAQRPIFGPCVLWIKEKKVFFINK